ncbi:mechanosensitive ion channel family protein [Shewanella xiamenensis]|uniref:mechanosensitive ion channel family protein n=1 Tax=Shewanella xiamenensis TaxID=332186 RepID=UPI000C12A0E2|nr:mechanosensitive ion channel family protein [Shewanella xiamenensis]MCL1072673.1 mechanosensitive ion channel family protein [Shewanella xiamenensis]MCR4536292.1 mechanosensitive ion channel family protein [Shewanella xiamenensis]MDI5876151.1 mechanosensitive ion channel family protein [Shewanella xiamenensis]PHY61165.1 mechanosensitive ion channel protein [Shewanella xiamenensis]GGN03403.1 mechanosensitive ion channel protein [Shewanella xiamenensis]
MRRSLILILALSFPLLMSAKVFAADPDPITTSPTASASNETQSELTTLQTAIKEDIARLAQYQGELRTIVEYRIQNKSLQLRNKIKTLLDNDSYDKALILPLVQEQLLFNQKINDYFNDIVSKLSKKLGTPDDDATLLEISKRELDKDNNYKQRLETLDWLSQLGQDVTAEKTQLTQILLGRADNFDSFVTYTQQQLQNAVNDATNAGKNVTSAQTSRVLQLKDRLAQNSLSLSIDIELLDALGQNTALLKKTLFSISGDITQDVLSIDVASSLIEQWLNTAKDQAINHGPTLVFKLFIFCLLLFVANLVGKLVKKIVSNTVSNSKLNFSKLLQDFFTSLSGKAVFTIGLLIALSQLGIELGPLLAGFGIAGVIIGFALQDTLSNFASGMMILIYRPYDVGDLINAAGVSGRVSHMSLVSTTIKTLDNQRLIIPNNKIWGDTINNITAEHQRRVDMTFGIGYGDSIEQAEAVLKSIVEAHPKVQKVPAPLIKLHVLGESSVDFIVRPWAKPEDYWDVYWDITREVKMRFDAEGISIPFPQRDVHIYQTSK